MGRHTRERASPGAQGLPSAAAPSNLATLRGGQEIQRATGRRKTPVYRRAMATLRFRATATAPALRPRVRAAARFRKRHGAAGARSFCWHAAPTTASADSSVPPSPRPHPVERRRRRRVSKDGPACTHDTPEAPIRNAALRAAPQDEALMSPFRSAPRAQEFRQALASSVTVSRQRDRSSRRRRLHRSSAALPSSTGRRTRR
jgi:hypothetical protein